MPLLLKDVGAATASVDLPSRAGSRLLGPDGRIHRCPLALLRDALCSRHEAPLAPGVDHILDAAGSELSA